MERLKALRRGRALFVVSLCVILFVLSSCAHQPRATGGDPPGFLAGLFHGFFIVFSFVASLFTDVRIYSFPNSGGGYDFGFLLGASMFLGGGGATGRRG